MNKLRTRLLSPNNVWRLLRLAVSPIADHGLRMFRSCLEKTASRKTTTVLKRSGSTWLFLTVLVLVVGFSSLAQAPLLAADLMKQHALIDRARVTLENFGADPDVTWFRDRIERARGVLIIPALWKGAFWIGGSGGRGVLLVRDQKTGEWSEPAFYTVGSGSGGLQFGGQKSEVVLMVGTQRGLDALYSLAVKLGGALSVAAGPVGTGAEGATPLNFSLDYVSFMRSKGAFIGLSLEGAVVAPNSNWNAEYYGKSVRPVDILVTREVSNPKSTELRRFISRLTSQPWQGVDPVPQ